MANLAPSNETAKLFSVEILLDPPSRQGHPCPLPSVLVIGIAYKHNHLTHTGTEYTYDLLRLQAQGLPNGRNFLNELRAPLLQHFDSLFFSERPSRGHAKGDQYGNYLRSEDYQYDRGEELREKAADPSNNL